MFKKILRPKNLIIFFLVVVVVTISYGIIIVEAASVDHYRSNATTIIQTNTDLAAIGVVGCKRIDNTSGNDYFVPAKTLYEWDQFVSYPPTGVSVLSGVCCETAPAGTFVLAEYWKSSQCGSYPTCPYTDAVSITENSLGGSCGLLKKWRHTRCLRLTRPITPICGTQQCITAAVRQTDWNQIRFCTGVYDSDLHQCMYTGSTLKTVDEYGWASVWADWWIWESSLEDTVTWGTCSSAAPCGDSICSTEYGETCASCPGDCGACPCGDGICGAGEDVYNCPADCYYCGDGICSSPYEDTYTCAYDCGSSCDVYYYQYDCDADYDCQWDSYDYCCYDLWDSCSSWYGQYDCEMYGCQWDSNNYACHEYCY